MRLGQLARKYNLSQQQIVNFLEKHNPGMGPYNHNTKLSDQTEELIANHFNKSFGDVDFDQQNNPSTPTAEANEIKEEKPQIPEVEEPIGTREAEQDVNSDIEADIQAKLDPTLPVPAEQQSEEIEEKKAISTDKLIEILDSEDENVDLSDITLIKAPKKELEGLKVVGKIDLPEPKPKTEKTKEPSETKKDKPVVKRRHKRELTPEEKEQRRLRAKKKKEAFEARQEKRRKEEEARRLKARKKAHYESKVKQTKINGGKPKAGKSEVKEDIAPKSTVAKPKTAFGRFWAWFWRGQKFEE